MIIKTLVNANTTHQTAWDNLGLLLQLSLGFMLLIGAFYSSFDDIMTFVTQSWILLIAGLLLFSGIKVQESAFVTMAIMLWYVMTKLTLDKSFIDNLN